MIKVTSYMGDLVLSQLAREGSPVGVFSVVFIRFSDIITEEPFTRTKLDVILLSLSKGHRIRTAFIIGIVELNPVIFPKTDSTNVVCAWRFFF